MAACVCLNCGSLRGRNSIFYCSEINSPLTSWISPFYRALTETSGDSVAHCFPVNCPWYLILVFATWLWQPMALLLLLVSQPGPARTSGYGAGAVFVGRWSTLCATSTWDRFVAMATEKKEPMHSSWRGQWKWGDRVTFEVDLDEWESFGRVGDRTMTFWEYKPHEWGPGGINATLCIWEKMPHLGASEALGTWSGTVRNVPARPSKGQGLSAAGQASLLWFSFPGALTERSWLLL